MKRRNHVSAVTTCPAPPARWRSRAWRYFPPRSRMPPDNVWDGEWHNVLALYGWFPSIIRRPVTRSE
jgi:hypothetical protein